MSLAILFALHSLASAPALAEEPPAVAISIDELLQGVSKNLNAESRSSTLKMTVTTARRTRQFEMKASARGLDESAIEYLSPARDKGTRLLRKGDELWMFLPTVERTQKISGHMLRQGMMGSDLSYEDITSSTDWDAQYDGKIVGMESLDDRDHYKVELVAHDEAVSYPKRVVWIDKERLIPSKQELYAASGMLLKTWTMGEVKDCGNGRSYPLQMRIDDKLKEGSFTVIETSALEFGVPLPDETFSVRWLERGG